MKLYLKKCSKDQDKTDNDQNESSVGREDQSFFPKTDDDDDDDAVDDDNDDADDDDNDDTDDDELSLWHG